MEKVRIADLEINYQDVLKALTELAQGIRATKENTAELEKEQARLREEGKIGTDQYAQNAKAIEQNKVVLAGLSSEYKNNQNLLISNVAAQDTNIGTLDKLAARNKELRLQLKGLNLETEEGQKQQKAYIQEINKNTDFIKKNTDAQTAQLMNVGNYKSALDLLPGSLKNAASGFQTVGNAAKAFLANPIGIVILAITAAVSGLIKIFQKFDPIIDKIEQGMAALGAMFKFVQTSIIGLITGQKGHNESMREAIDLAVQLKKAEQDLWDAQTKLVVSNAKSKRQIDELILQSKDRTKSEAERQALIDKALQIEEQQYLERKAIADKEVEIAQGKIIAGRNLTDAQIAQLKEQGVAYAIQLKDTKAITDEEVESLANALAEQENILDESVAIREKAINRRNALEESAQAAEEKRAEKAAKIAEDKKKQLDEMEQAIREYENSVVKESTDAFQKAFDDTLKMLQDSSDAVTAQMQTEVDTYIAGVDQMTEAMMLDLENEKQLRLLSMQDEFSQRELQLQYDYDAEISNAKKIGADVSLINKKYALQEKALEKEKQTTKYKIISDFVGAVGGLFGEQTAIAKAAAATQTVINTYLGAMAAFAQTPGPVYVKALAAGVAVATGIASLKKILSADGKGGGGGNANISDIGGATGSSTESSTGSSTTIVNAASSSQSVLVIEDYQKVERNQINVRVSAEV